MAKRRLTMFNLDQLTTRSTLATWYPERPAAVQSRNIAAMLAALDAAGTPLTAAQLHREWRVCSTQPNCNNLLRQLVREKRVVRVCSIRPYTYTLPPEREA